MPVTSLAPRGSAGAPRGSAGAPRGPARAPGSRFLALAGALALLAGCQANPAAMDVPGVQKLTWFAYLDAEDLRAECAPGRPDRYRLVYNGHYAEQLRTYEVTESPLGGGRVEAAAQEGSGIGVSLRNLDVSDPFATWAWRRATRQIDAAAFSALRGALVESGATASPPDGLRLRSNAFYWTAAGCLDGLPFFHAWLYDEGGFARLRFPERLFALDDTGVAVNPARERDPGERTSANTTAKQSGAVQRIPYFVLQVGEDGLRGGPIF